MRSVKKAERQPVIEAQGVIHHGAKERDVFGGFEER